MKPKAIFILGKPASGKSYYADQLHAKLGYVVIDTDKEFEPLLKKFGLPLDLRNADEDAVEFVRKEAIKRSRTHWASVGQKSQSFIYTGTGISVRWMTAQVERFKALGYECYIVYIDVDTKTAIKRNAARARTIPAELIKSYSEIPKEHFITNFTKLVGEDHFMMVDNNNPSEGTIDQIKALVECISISFSDILSEIKYLKPKSMYTEFDIDHSRVVDFLNDAELTSLFKDEFPEGIDALEDWLENNPTTLVRLYHGTSATAPIEKKGLLPTTMNRRNSYQSQSGYVYLSIFPEMAKTFAQMAYPAQPVRVYTIEVPVYMLRPDTDQLNNKRHYSDYDGPDNLAASLIIGHGARVKGKIPTWFIKKHEEYK
jgi:adenylate kinase family enzyme